MTIADSKCAQINPVYAGYFADPFVWASGREYFAVGTGALEAGGHVLGKIFPVLQSDDFRLWKFSSNALVRPDASLGTHFWAPEVAESEGKFYLYYSVGHGDANHQLRVAVGDRPQGPYHDTGARLLSASECPFAIDPHPFRDEDGRWYLFYARDFLDTTPEYRAGTALMMARMKSMTELEDSGRMIVRARWDWQRFQQKRFLYGRVWDWHTIEGPFVRKHEGRYYCFYSAGCWTNESYGVDYCVADRVGGPYSDAGNENGPRVLRTLPGRLIGPGHNSIITGPNGSGDYIVYHAWDGGMKARRMFMDKLVWTPQGPRCDGPSWGPVLNP